jgi:tripartite-type tricarboxylate transporter receptor subunit TctC
MKETKLSAAFILTVVSTLTLFTIDATAQLYPTRPVSIIVPFAPGGNSDLGARAFAAIAEKHLGQPMVVVNKPGGRSLIGGKAVAVAKPDGYTVGFLQLQPAIPEAYNFFQEAPYSSKDIRPVAQIFIPPVCITVKADAPWKSLKELIEYARKNPNTPFATHGDGSLGHLLMVSIAKTERVTFKYVPNDGDSKIVANILGGHIPVGSPAYIGIKAQVDAKKMKILATMTPKRLSTASDVPTVVELGYKLPFLSFQSFFVPKGTPDQIVEKLNAVSKKVCEDPSFIDKLQSLGIQVNYQGTKEFTETLVGYKSNIETLFKELGYVKR